MKKSMTDPVERLYTWLPVLLLVGLLLAGCTLLLVI